MTLQWFGIWQGPSQIKTSSSAPLFKRGWSPGHPLLDQVFHKPKNKNRGTSLFFSDSFGYVLSKWDYIQINLQQQFGLHFCTGKLMGLNLRLFVCLSRRWQHSLQNGGCSTDENWGSYHWPNISKQDTNLDVNCRTVFLIKLASYWEPGQELSLGFLSLS